MGSAQIRQLVCEITVSVVLLVCSSVFISTLLRLHASNPGFDMNNLLTVQLRAPRPDRKIDPVIALRQE
jgi:hypothetical protein